MITLTYHANLRIQTRFVGLLTAESVQAECNKRAAQIAHKQSEFEVLVVVRSFGRKVFCSDGSNGQFAVAAVDPRKNVIKTVMLRRTGQLERDPAVIR